MNDQSAIIHSDGGTMLLGDATLLPRYVGLKHAVIMWRDSKMVMRRGLNIRLVLDQISSITHKVYRCSPAGYDAAIADMDRHIAVFRASLPDIDKRTKP